MKKFRLKDAIIILFPLFLIMILFGCQSSSGSGSDDDANGDSSALSVGDSVTMATSTGGTITAAVIDLDEDGTADGLDLDEDTTTLEFVFLTTPDSSSSSIVSSRSRLNSSQSTESEAIYEIDINGDNSVDFYLHVLDSDTGLVQLNTTEDATGIEVKIILDSSGKPTDIDTDGDGSSDIVVIPVLILEDKTVPTIGDSGTITTSSVLSTSLTLNWTRATDSGTPAEFLRYKVIQSTADNLGTVADALTSGDGRTTVQDWTYDIATLSVTDLNAETTYYFTVLVKDAAGNTAIYTTKSQATANLEMTGSWSMVGGGSDGIISYSSSVRSMTPDLETLNANLYAAWQERDDSSGSYHIRVKEWDGTSWTFIDGVASNGINKNTDKDAETPRLEVLDSNLYAIWSEDSDTVSQIRVAKRSDDSTWQFIDGGEDTGLSAHTHFAAKSPELLEKDSKLYAIWTEKNSYSKYVIKVREWDGDGDQISDWAFLGSAGDSDLNVDAEKDASSPRMALFNSEIYATWSEATDGQNQIRVKKWDGDGYAETDWSLIDGGASDTGINYNSANEANTPDIIAYDDKLYVTWSEKYGTLYQIRVAAWDGTSWSFVDGNGVTGINYDTNNDGFNPRFLTFHSNLYITWSERDSNFISIVRVKEWDGSEWNFVDGNTDPDINYDASDSGRIMTPSLIEYDSHLHVIWDEGNSHTQSIRVKKAEME